VNLPRTIAAIIAITPLATSAADWQSCATKYVMDGIKSCTGHGTYSSLTCWGSMGVRAHVENACGTQPANVGETFWKQLGQRMNEATAGPREEYLRRANSPEQRAKTAALFAQHDRPAGIKSWRTVKKYGGMSVQGVTSQPGRFIEAAIDCNGTFAGTSVSGIGGSGTFDMWFSDLPNSCDNVTLHSASIR
jgi:hypothetical protein